MAMHEATISTVMVFVLAAAAGLFFLLADRAISQGTAFLLGIVS